ncbi:MDR family MFS transporter [Salirhabdus sp. Marseille-P4669]|uniref:MDR family MFS transporter n=1 Tax=Salirhabdus sp. Marseille-P4669 TaxID=2042310 RepID=UPI000C7B173E|nr:MDR family MFS transporter [Salirhabdus sp. Marseille-P4669]
MEGTAQQNKPAFNRTTLVAVLLSGAFAAILNQTLLATALPEIMADLHIDENTAQWLQSIFMLVNGIMIPITAFLIETFTTRRLFLTAMGLFALGTLLCAIAPSFLVLLAGRVVQAAGAGIMMPLMQTVFLFIFPFEKRGSAMGMVGLIIAFAPAIGPTLSGWVVEHFDWRYLFYIILPIAILDLIIAYFVLKNVTKQTFPKVDVLSIILSTLGFGGILYGFSIAGNAGWSSVEVLIGMVVGVLSLIWFIIRQFQLEQPILEFRVFKYNIFTLTTILGCVVFVSMIGAAVILPLYMQNMHHFTPLESGLMLLPGAIIMGAMSPITGRIFDKVGAKWLTIVGLSIVTITTFLFTNLSTTTSFTFLTIAHAFRMLGISMVMMPVTTAGLNQLPNRLIPHGTAMNNTMRQVAGSVGTALLVTIMTTGATSQTPEGMIDGVNLSFIVAAALSVIALIMAFFIKRTTPEEEK